MASQQLQQQIDEAKRILYVLNEKGEIVGKTPLFQEYEQNAAIYAKARQEYAEAQNKALATPATAASWPLLASTYQEKVNSAFNTWKTEGAEQVERAQDLLGSVSIKPSGI